MMQADRFDALIVYGNTKMGGSLRYLSGFFVDRTGWVSLGPSREDLFIFDGAALVVPTAGEPILLIEPGHMITSTAITSDVRGGGLTGGGEDGLTPKGVADALNELGATGRVGVETWDRFPAPLYLGIREQMPHTVLERSTVVETARLVKTHYEVERLREAGRVGDVGHQAFVDALRNGPAKTELQLIRIAEGAMREMNPIYEDTVPSSPSLISSGDEVHGLLLHAPLPDKYVRVGDVVNWDICSRYHGYAVDTSRTRVLGEVSHDQDAAYSIALEMAQAVRDAAKPGAVTTDLVTLAKDVASAHGASLWLDFLGHGIGLDCHERPDMGVEEMVLEENMVITVEPRVVFDHRFLMANEDMVLVTPDGGTSLTSFPREPLGLDI